MQIDCGNILLICPYNCYKPQPSVMKKLRFLRIHFLNEIAFQEIPLFRGAVIAHVSSDSILFHNHQGSLLRYGYPLIQYKRIRGRAGLICLEEGIEQVHDFFNNRAQQLQLGSRTIELSVEHLHLQEYTFQAWDRSFAYRLHNWMPFDAENYRHYKTLSDEFDQLSFLETILRGNLLTVAKGIHCTIEREVKVRINRIVRNKLLPYKGLRMQTFDLEFSCNVWLPPYIGLGRKPSIGFGSVTPLTNKSKINEYES